MPSTSKAPWLALVLLVAACRSAPVHYHTLTPLLDKPARTVPAGASLTLELLTVPPQVDRTQIVVREGANGLVVLETDWWGASLVDELQSALIDQLNQHPLANRATLRVDVQRFDLVPGRYALLDIRWRLRSATAGGGKPLELTCQSILRASAGPAVEALVMAQQANLAKAALQISESAQGSCPAS